MSGGVVARNPNGLVRRRSVEAVSLLLPSSRPYGWPNTNNYVYGTALVTTAVQLTEFRSECEKVEVVRVAVVLQGLLPGRAWVADERTTSDDTRGFKYRAD